MVMAQTDERGTFRCAACGETFDKAWSDEESWAEAEATWTPDELATGTSLVCDDCWERGMANVDALARVREQFAMMRDA